jgi:phage internal scaffolding protein
MSFTAHQSKRKRVAIDCTDYDENGEPFTLVEQHHKDALDIKQIIRNAKKGIISNHLKKYDGQFMNLPNSVDYHGAQIVIAKAKEMWATVPAKVRASFNNDPSAYVDFMQNPENYEKIKDMGMNPDYFLEEFRPKKPEPPEKLPKSPGEPSKEE